MNETKYENEGMEDRERQWAEEEELRGERQDEAQGRERIGMELSSILNPVVNEDLAFQPQHGYENTSSIEEIGNGNGMMHQDISMEGQMEQPKLDIAISNPAITIPNPITPQFPVPDEVGMEVDSAPSGSDTDSTMGDEIMSSTMSLRESVYAYLEENGRTYHAFNAGKYNLPNDEAEQERLNLQHHLFSLTFDGNLHIAPLPPALHNVLDIGTGTGIWATEFAEQYPMARVIGTDLSPIQPLYVPPNCSFEVNDAEDPWDYSQKFDYIHGRALLSCFRDPTFMIASAFSSLRPGGILELQDPQMPALCIDSSMSGTSLEAWSTVVPEGAANLGRVVTNSRFYPQWMREVGFVDVVEKHYYWPLNTWPRGKKEKMIGMWAQQNLLDGVEAMSMAILTRGLGWSKERVEMLLVGVRNDLRDRHVHAYIDVIVCYGRKPEPNHSSPLGSGYGSGAD